MTKPRRTKRPYKAKVVKTPEPTKKGLTGSLLILGAAVVGVIFLIVRGAKASVPEPGPAKDTPSTPATQADANITYTLDL